MREILEAISLEASDLGVDSAVVDDEFPTDDDVIYVVIPHELFTLLPESVWPSQKVLSRTIALTVEHPGTSHFDVSAMQARRCAAVMDINMHSVEELRARGLDSTHLPIGYTRAWDRWGGEEKARSTDIVYMGSVDQRRELLLARAATISWDRRVVLSLSDGAPLAASDSAYYLGERKLAQLADSHISLNIHRGSSTAFEWVRNIESICNGAVVVSEHSVDIEPLVSGRHFVSVHAEHIGSVSRGLLDEPQRLAEIRAEAYWFIRDKLPLAASVERLLEIAEALLRHPRHVPDSNDVPPPPAYSPSDSGWPTQTTQLDLIASGIRRLEGRLRSTERKLERLSRKAGSTPDEPIVYETPRFAQVEPQVTVIIPLHNHAAEVREALESLEASTEVDYDVIVQDDASTDDSLQVVTEFLRKRPWFPAKVVSVPKNRGLSATRNDLWRAARGEYIFALDSDNGVYPPALSRLAQALDDAPDAAFAYSILVALELGQPTALISQYPWQPERLRFGNYIDAMAMLRRDTLVRFGGWSEAMQFGWEDFHLWARIGDARLPAAFVPQPLCWYRRTAHSMLSSTNLDVITLWSQIRGDAPNLMRDSPQPVQR